MSTNKEFDALVADLDIPDSVICEACQEDIATVRVAYSCNEPNSLLCGRCMIAYAEYIMRGMAKTLLTGGPCMAHKCGAPLGNLGDLARHIQPENIDGTEFDPDKFM